VDFVEIDEKAFLECRDNLRKSPFHQRLKAIHSNLLDFQPKELYTTVITNPPYYTSDNFSTSRNQREKHLSTKELHTWITHCSQLLAPLGTLWFIVPTSSKGAIEEITERLKMSIHREIHVQNQQGLTVRIVMEISQLPFAKESSILKLRNADGSYSDEYIDLTTEFHGITLQKQLKLHET
jgi:tRNA1Val (adenine37-N6)-methyltransferase